MVPACHGERARARGTLACEGESNGAAYTVATHGAIEGEHEGEPESGRPGCLGLPGLVVLFQVPFFEPVTERQAQAGSFVCLD